MPKRYGHYPTRPDGTRIRPSGITPTTKTPRLITVCDHCLKASCWQGVYMCEEARGAGTRRMTESELRELDAEHPDYWLTDEELANGVKPGAQTRCTH